MKSIFASALLCCSLAAHAEGEMNTENMPVGNLESDVGRFNIVLAAAVTFGGDDLAVATNDQTVTAGGLIYLGAGGVYHVSTALDIQLTFGYHFDSIEATNGTAEFTRSFVELMPYYVADSGNRFGVGIAHIVSPESSNPFGTVHFDDANGLVVEYDWMLARHFFLGVRYADLSYKSSDGLVLMTDGSVTDTIDGNYFGVIIQGHF